MNRKANKSPNSQLRRYIALARILTRNRFGLTKEEIIEKLRKEDIAPPSHRTFQRDIEELRMSGYDISCGDEYRYKLENREEIVSGAFSLEEIQALQMCRDLFTYFDGTHLKDSIDSALNAVIGSQKTPFSKEDLEEIRQNFMVHLGWRRDFLDKRELLDSVAYGVNSSTKLKISYKKPNHEIQTVTVEPYRIALYHDSLYLLAKKENSSRGLHLYHISRFEEVVETSEEFVKENRLVREYEEKLSHCFGIFIDGDLCDIEIKFDKSVEYMLRERLWHGSQTVETKENCVILKLRVYKSGEFMAWVKGWGDLVKGISSSKATP